jgi:hypothetical protein
MNQILVAILGIVSALLLAKVQSLLSENAKLREEVNQQKHEVYTKLAGLLKGIIDGDEVQDIDKKFNELNNKIIFFASAKVLKAFGDFRQHIFKAVNPSGLSAKKIEDNNFQTLKLYAELIVAMREDLGIDRMWTRLSWADVVRPHTTDIKEYTPRRFSRHRKRQTLPVVRFKKHHRIIAKKTKS